MARSRQYESYLNSFDWYLKRRAALGRANNRCQKCGETRGLEVHHLTYAHLGAEREEDLLVVCKDCHEKEDSERKVRVERKVWEARVNGWAEKKYGEEWWINHDPESVEEEFNEWLEDKEELS